MSVLSRDQIVDATDRQLDELTCAICHGILNEPVMTDCCQHMYCRSCVTEWLATRGKCPNDGTYMASSHLKPVPRAVNNLIQDLKIKCMYQSEGCTSIVSIADLDDHTSRCEFRPNTSCKFCGLKRASASVHNCLESLLEQNISLKRNNSSIKGELAQALEERDLLKTIVQNEVKKVEGLLDNLMKNLRSTMNKGKDGCDDEEDEEEEEEEQMDRRTRLLIEGVRGDLHGYKIREVDNIDEDMLYFIVDNCKELLAEKNDFMSIAEALHNSLKSHPDYGGSLWNVVVGYSPQFGWFTDFAGYLYLEFGDIDICVTRFDS